MPRKGIGQETIILAGFIAAAVIFGMILLNYYTGFFTKGLDVFLESWNALIRSIGKMIPIIGGK